MLLFTNQIFVISWRCFERLQFVMQMFDTILVRLFQFGDDLSIMLMNVDGMLVIEFVSIERSTEFTLAKFLDTFDWTRPGASDMSWRQFTMCRTCKDFSSFAGPSNATFGFVWQKYFIV